MIRKFAVAIDGLIWACRTQNSFWVHGMALMVVIALAAWLSCPPWQWVALSIVATIVWTAELLNTAIECLAAKLHPQHDETIGRALDVAAAAVLVAAIGAVFVGLTILGPPLLAMMGNVAAVIDR